MTPERWRHVTAIFHAAMAREAAARDAFLVEASAGDASVISDVEALIAAHTSLAPHAGASPAGRSAADDPPLASGTMIGVYQIEALIGGGGQARVYRGRDVRIGKTVAIKVLPAGWLDGPDARLRFDREARVLAALNHPNIATIHGLAEGNGQVGLVLELVEGPTLAERLARGPMTVADAVPLARQIALALEAAHERGIIHRDLKPANIKLTHEGAAKVLDFGLAKLSTDETVSADAPTTTLAGTREGLVVGTPAYMSPEQARGRPVDRRTDVWAFGCVVYEMLTGRSAFRGDTTSDTLAAVLEREPVWNALPAALPDALRTLLRRCLEKDPARRLRDIGDARLEIDDLLAAPAPGTALSAAAPAVRRARGRAVLMLGAVAAVALAAVSAVQWWGARTMPGPAQPAVHLPVDLGADVSLPAGTGPAVLLSPNGERLVYISNDRLVTRRLDQSAPVVLAGTDGAITFFFSPDGESVAFSTGEQLKRVVLDGGLVTTIGSALGSRGGTWSEDGVIVATGGSLGTGLSRLRVDGGNPEVLTRLEPGEFTHRWPQFLPGGNAVLFTRHTWPWHFDLAGIEVVSLADGRRQVVQEGASFGRWVPGADRSGFLTFVRAGTLFAVPFDPIGLELRGTPVPVLEQVATNDTGSAQVDASGTGTLVYRSDPRSRLLWLSGRGPGEPVLAEAGFYRDVAVSRDGRRVAFSAGRDVFVHDVGQQTPSRLTRDVVAGRSVWTSDGRFIVFATPQGIKWIRADGGSEPQDLLPGRSVVAAMPGSFNDDGTRLAFMEISGDGVGFWNLWTTSIRVEDGALRASEPQAFLGTSFDERNPAFSPDGQWMAYSSNESGTTEVYVRAFPDDGRKWRMSDGGGTEPRWSPARPHLFYRHADRLRVVPYTVTGSTFVPGRPTVWSEELLASGHVGHAVALDGRVAAIVPDAASQQRSRRYVTFWINAPRAWRPAAAER